MAEKLSFYDVKSKKKFTTDKYKIVIRNKRRFAVATNPKTKVNCWRVLGMAKAKAAPKKKSCKKK